MEPKARTCEEAAVECAAALSDEDIAYFRLHIGYTHHHFGYGLYLRNRYSYLLDKEMCGMCGDLFRDGLGESIYHLMIPMVFPEFKGYEQYINRITDFDFDDLNANYNLKFDRNFIADITPEQFFSVPNAPSASDDDISQWMKLYEKENKQYALAIAERIWEYDTFKSIAGQLGYSDSEIKEIHRLCMKLIKKKRAVCPVRSAVCQKCHNSFDQCYDEVQ